MTNLGAQEAYAAMREEFSKALESGRLPRMPSGLSTLDSFTAIVEAAEGDAAAVTAALVQAADAEHQAAVDHARAQAIAAAQRAEQAAAGSLGWSPFDGSDPDAATISRMNQSEIELVGKILDGPRAGFMERAAQREAWEKATADASAERAAAAEQAARESDPAYIRERMATLAMRDAMSLDAQGLLEKSYRYGLVDTTGEPGSWKTTELVSALPDDYERSRLEATVARVRPAPARAGMIGGIQIGDHDVTLAPESGPAAA